MPCVDGFCPLGREGPLGCRHVTSVSLAMAKQLLRLVHLELSLLALLPLMCPARLKAADACVLITILCWPDGWSHGADSVWQACNDATQCAQAAGPRPDDILVRGLAAEPPRSGVKGAS